MRSHRPTKFSEFVSTYAILQNIGLHNTVVVERRDSHSGFGVFVRDACDSGTCLLVIPSRRFCSNSVLQAVGTPVRFHDALAQVPQAELVGLRQRLEGGLMAHLCRNSELRRGDLPDWVEWCWRVSLESHRSFSPLWGWLQALPRLRDLRELTERAETTCRVEHPALLPHYTKAQQQIREELAAAYALLERVTITAPPTTFLWMGLVLLSRGQVLPRCWRHLNLPQTHCHPSSPSSSSSSPSSSFSSSVNAVGVSTDDSASGSRHDASDVETAEGPGREEPALELGVIPYADLLNGPDSSGRSPNAGLEVATDVEELPDWYVATVLEECRKRGTCGRTYLERLFRDHYCACVTLQKPLLPADEVITDYFQPVVSTGGRLDEEQDIRLSRLLKYFY